jgi:ParE toxin of type II toxin-antitoxin system, parDE
MGYSVPGLSRYPLVPRYEHWGMRRCVHGDYLIFYRVRSDAVEIVRIRLRVAFAIASPTRFRHFGVLGLS